MAIKTIFLGGYNQPLKLLQKYKYNTNDIILPAKSIAHLLSPKYGHNESINNLKSELKNHDAVYIHSISLSSWYLMTFFQNITDVESKKIKGLILESNPYYFSYDRMIRYMKNQNSFISDNQYNNIIDNFLWFNGVDDNWKQNYIETISTLEPMLHKKIFILGSSNDPIIKENQPKLLYDKLCSFRNNYVRRETSVVKLHLGNSKKHSHLLKYDPLYNIIRKEFYEA